MTRATGLPRTARNQFAVVPDSFSARIEQVLDPVVPMRLKDIAAAVDHDGSLMSGFIDNLLAQGRIRRVDRGMYVRVVAEAAHG
jgi:hypothetical protein